MSAAASAAAPTKIKIVYNTKAATFMAPAVAIDAGIFKKYGIDAQFDYAAGSAAVAAMISGEAQFGQMSDPNVTNAHLQGADIEWIAVTSHVPLLKLMGQPSVPDVQALKGKQVAVTAPGSLTALYTNQVLSRAGLNPKTDVTVRSIGSANEALAMLLANQADATILGLPQYVQAGKQGKKVLVDLKSAGGYSLQGGLSVLKSYADAHPDVVANVVKAYLEGTARFKSDTELAERVIARETGASDPDILEPTYHDTASVLDPTGIPDPAAEQAVLEQLAQTEPKAKTASAASFIDDRFVRQAAAQK